MTSRQFHRWVGTVAAVLFFLVSITGVVLQSQQIFGGDEAKREEMAKIVSPQRLDQPFAATVAMLDDARNAVNTRYKNAPISAVDWQFKGNPPLIVFHLDGEQKLRVSVDAKTSNIVKTDPDGESWILRLHTGEIMGDGGKFLGLLWGLALVAMTFTGVLMYLQIVRARGRSGRTTGFKRWFWMLALVAFLPPHTARAGSPFLTDDPGFAPKGWEIKAESLYEKTINGTTITPVLDLNYTIVPTFKINLTLAGKNIDPRTESSEYGMADTDFKFKWRFVEEDLSGWRPAGSIAPNVTLPTADKNKGLGDEVWRLRLPVQIGKTFGKWYSYAETGYQWALNDSATDVIPYGVATQYQLTDKLSLGVELNGNVPVDDRAQWTMLANVGGSYALTDSVQLQASLGRTVRDTDRGGSEVLMQTFVQWNF